MNGPQGRFFESDELRRFGFKAVGKNVRIHEAANIVGQQSISLGDNVRIDAFVNIVAVEAVELRIGSYVHIGSFVNVAASGGVTIGDFAGLSQGVRVYSASDDFGGDFLTGPTVPKEMTNPKVAPVVVGRHCVVGTGSTVLPGVTIGEGSTVGAMSLVLEDLQPWGVYLGIPARRVRDRSRKLLEFERQLQERRP